MNPQVLVIDDDPSILEVIELILNAEGFEVLKANNGEKGIDLAKKHLPNAVILDVIMPKMSGYMVATILKKDENTKHIPILLLTSTQQMTGGILMEAPTTYKLSKPFKPDDLVKMLIKMIADTAEKTQAK